MPSPSPSLLESKFQPQLGARAQVARSRLALPDALLEGNIKAVTVVAPTGYGKSTLMAQWHAALTATDPRRLCAAWLNLDENDNDAPRLLRYLYGALGKCVPTLAADAVLEIARTANLAVMLEDLSIRLAAHEQPIVLFLDDAHVITNLEAAQLVEWLLSHAQSGAQGQIAVELHQRKRSIAVQLGIAPETFSRVLRHLREQSLISGSGRVLNLVNPNALRSLAGV